MARLQIAFRTERGKDSVTESESFLCKENLFLVAEGVGGDYLGEVARETAYKGISSHFFNHLSKERSPGSALVSALKEANEEMLREGKKTGKKIAASVSVIFISGKIMYFSHLGDSRIYCLQRGEIVQLTRDHTVGEEDSYAEIGGGDPRILRALTDGLGIHEKPEIKVKTFALGDDDIILMTTEGLTRYLSNMQILKLSMKQNSVKKLAARLIDEAKRKGARDIMTLGIIRFKELPIPFNRRVAAFSALLLALAFVGGYAVKSRHESRPPEEKIQAEPARKQPARKSSEPRNAEPVRAPSSHHGTTHPAEETTRKEIPLKQEIHLFLKEWKTAWENTAGPEGNIAAYMSFYSEDFRSEGLNKTAWRQTKAERNKKKQWIKVELKEIFIGEPGPDNRLEVHFLQGYKSSNLSVSTSKSLILKRENNGWKICSEKAV